MRVSYEYGTGGMIYAINNVVGTNEGPTFTDVLDGDGGIIRIYHPHIISITGIKEGDLI